MKTLIILDSDGHITAFEVTKHNLKECVKHCLEAGLMEDEDEAHDIVDGVFDYTVEEMISVLEEDGPLGQRSGPICVLDIQPELHYKYNPLF
jgi:hypothetical protein